MKFLKFIAYSLVIVILLAVVAVGLLVTFISPDRLKPVMTDQVMKMTGRQLTIDGPMSWTFFPYLGVKVGHMELGNPANFSQKEFAELTGATVGVKLLPLLHGRIQSSGVVLKGLKLTLIKNAQGAVNWAFPQKQPTPALPATSQMILPRKNTASFGVAISAVDISNANVTYTDEQTHKFYDIKNFNLQAKDINLIQPFPVKASLDFAAKNPTMSGHVTLTSDVALNMDAQIYSFRNLIFTLQAEQQGKKIDMTLQGNLIADLTHEMVQWTDFQGQIANVKLLGKMSVMHLNTAPEATGHMTIQPFDLKQTLQMLGENTASLQIAKDARGELDFIASAKTTTAQADLTIDTLQAEKLKLTQVNMKANFENGVLTAPLTANLYQGTLNGTARVNLTSAVPQIAVQGQLTNIQAQPMLLDLQGPNQKLTVQGAGNIKINLTTSGSAPNDIVQHLNGTSQFSFVNGSLIGLDLGYLVDSAYALLKHNPAPISSHQTNFGNLTGTAVIQNGVLTNNDLLINSPRFTTHGKGIIDLVKQTINYTLQATVNKRGDQTDDSQNLYNINLPITITGSLDNPSIRLDSAAITRELATQQIQKAAGDVKKKFQDQIKQQLPGKANELLNNFLGQH